jgi:hypothetical protein
MEQRVINHLGDILVGKIQSETPLKTVEQVRNSNPRLSNAQNLFHPMLNGLTAIFSDFGSSA